MDAVVDAAPFSTIDLMPRTGTEVIADAATLASGTISPALRQILEQRGVLVFRDVNLSDEKQLKLSESLGTLVRHGGDPIQEITLDTKLTPTAEYLKGSFFWHIDGATGGTPDLAALLGARRLSPEGGQTHFANTYAAWDDLPESEESELENLRVVHSFDAA
jgi:alpha-ketoglutarate-dependent taurine dioxygenase